MGSTLVIKASDKINGTFAEGYFLATRACISRERHGGSGSPLPDKGDASWAAADIPASYALQIDLEAWSVRV
jgi:hypothetical protein